VRRLVASGAYLDVECAVRADETSPASELLDQLAEGTWPDPEAESLPDEWQPRYLQRLIALCQALAAGDSIPDNAFNALEDGVLEFKIDGLRVTFYDTDGRGNCGVTEIEYYDDWSGKRRPVLPEFEEYVRLGHVFPKTGQKTRPEDIQQSLQVRKEDLEHDA